MTVIDVHTHMFTKSWLELLKNTFQWFELPAYHGNALKRAVAVTSERLTL